MKISVPFLPQPNTPLAITFHQINYITIWRFGFMSSFGRLFFFLSRRSFAFWQSDMQTLPFGSDHRDPYFGVNDTDNPLQLQTCSWEYIQCIVGCVKV